MKTPLLLFILGFIFSSALSQDEIAIKIVFEKDDSVTDITSLFSQFTSDNIVTNFQTDSNKILVPRKLFNKRGDLQFAINSYKIVLHNIPIAWNEQNLQWIVGLDDKPFNKEKFWTIKNWKRIRSVHYLDYNNGKIMTECIKD